MFLSIVSYGKISYYCKTSWRLENILPNFTNKILLQNLTTKSIRISFMHAYICIYIYLSQTCRKSLDLSERYWKILVHKILNFKIKMDKFKIKMENLRMAESTCLLPFVQERRRDTVWNDLYHIRKYIYPCLTS